MPVGTGLRNPVNIPLMNTRGASGIALLALLVSSPAATSGAGPALHALFEEYWEYRLERSPSWATDLGDHRYDDRLEDLSLEAQLANLESLRGFRDRVVAIAPESLDPADRLSAELFRRMLERNLDGAGYRPWEISVTQLSGIHIGFPQIVESHPFDTVKGCEDFVARLSAFPVQVDQVIENLRAGIASGNVRFRGNLEKAVPQVRGLGSREPAEHPLARSLEKMGEDLSGADRARLERKILAGIENDVLPAYRKLGDFLEDEYVPACRLSAGILGVPDGVERYTFLVRRYTTTGLSPEEIHEIGLEEMKRIRGEMEGIRQRVQFEGDLDAFLLHLRHEPSFYCETKEELMEGFRSILRAMDDKLPQLFGNLPEAPYDLKEMESWRAAAAPAAYYYRPPADGSRPGYFYVNTYDLPSRPRYTMEALAYHEAVPGHHLQIALQQKLDLPEFRRHEGFTAFVEGWGLYSESLPKEVGAYADPYSEFGRLTFDAWRASRLVVDTGMHALGWSRQDAIEYLSANSALSLHDIESEVDRYIAWPGQALAYKIGELKIRELRSVAEDRLAERFDVRAFHDRVLEGGALPLDLLEEIVLAWIEEQATAGEGSG